MILATYVVAPLFCLTLLTVLPGCQTGSKPAGTSSANTKIAAKSPDISKPLSALAWSPARIAASDQPTLNMHNGIVEPQPGEQELHIPHVVPMFWLKADSTPEQAKAALDQQPEGYRCMIWVWNGIGGDPLKNEADKIKAADGSLVRSIWADHGIAQTAGAMRDFFTEYKKIGGKVDYIVMDYEDGLTRWHRGMTAEAFAAIENDPRFKAEGWPEKLGFSDLPKELVKTPYPSENQKKWNLFMKAQGADILNQSIYEPVRKFFPNVKISNYGNAYTPGVPDINGHIHDAQAVDGIYHVGTHQSAETYGRINPGLAGKKLDGERAFGSGTFKSLVLGVNSARAMAMHHSVPFMPWISYRAFAGESCFYGNTDYYQELVLHVAMTNPDVILLWNPHQWKAGQNPATCSDNAQDQLVGRLLAQFNELAGFAERRTLVTELSDWYGSFVLSGMTLNGRSVWRLTPELDLTVGEKADMTLVSTEPLTFSVKGRTVTFRNGRMVKAGNTDAPLGFWIITPMSEKPVVN